MLWRIASSFLSLSLWLQNFSILVFPLLSPLFCQHLNNLGRLKFCLSFPKENQKLPSHKNQKGCVAISLREFEKQSFVHGMRDRCLLFSYSVPLLLLWAETFVSSLSAFSMTQPASFWWFHSIRGKGGWRKRNEKEKKHRV